MTYRVIFSERALEEAAKLPGPYVLAVRNRLSGIQGYPYAEGTYQRGTYLTERAVDTDFVMISYLVDERRKEMLVTGLLPKAPRVTAGPVA